MNKQELLDQLANLESERKRLKSSISEIEEAEAEAKRASEEQNRRVAEQLIANKMTEVDKLLKECEVLAQAHDCHFTWSGPSYGMGGSLDSDDGWYASSQSC